MLLYYTKHKITTYSIYIYIGGFSMNNLFGSFSNSFNNLDCDNLDINKLLVILLLLTDKLNIEAIHIYRNNFIVSLGTFTED